MVYVAFVIDAYSRGYWAGGLQLDEDRLVWTRWSRPVDRKRGRRPRSGRADPPHRRGQPVHIHCVHRPARHRGISASVGTVGDAYDNALAESVNGLFKTELIKPRGPWRTAEQVEIATLEYVDWYNHRSSALRSLS